MSEVMAPPTIPIVLRQRWVLTLPTGASYDAGYSFHLTEEDRVAFIAEVLAQSERWGLALAGQDQASEEALGDAELFQTTPAHFKLVQESAPGLRSR